MKIFVKAFILSAVLIFNYMHAMQEDGKKTAFNNLMQAVKNNDILQIIQAPAECLTMATKVTHKNLLHVAAESETTTPATLDFLIDQLVDRQVCDDSKIFFVSPLLDINAVDANGSTPLHLVTGDYRFTEDEMPEDETEIYSNLSSGKALLLIEAGASVHVQDRAHMTPLDRAVLRNDLSIIRCLLLNNARILPQSIEWAMYVNNVDLAQELLTTLKDSEVDQATRNMPQLYYAAFLGCSRFVDYVLKNGCAVEELTEVGRRTALCCAMQRFHGQTVNVIVDHIHDVNLYDSEGNTPLHCAVRLLDVNLVRKLLAKNANPNLQDKSGRVPIVYALQQKISPERDYIVSTLMRHGASSEWVDCDQKNVKAYLQGDHDRMLVERVCKPILDKKRVSSFEIPQAKKMHMGESCSSAAVELVGQGSCAASQQSLLPPAGLFTYLVEAACARRNQVQPCNGGNNSFNQLSLGQQGSEHALQMVAGKGRKSPSCDDQSTCGKASSSRVVRFSVQSPLPAHL